MLYEFLRDQRSLIAGVLTLIAGILAYRAGDPSQSQPWTLLIGKLLPPKRLYPRLKNRPEWLRGRLPLRFG